jgi:hypothetical protein
MNQLRTITVPAGIGDFIWLAMKLINSGEKFNIKLPDGSPQRGHQILELLPELVGGYQYTPKLSYKKINENNIQSYKSKWGQITEKEFYLSANTHLESGFRLEKFLPDLPITYRLKYDTKAEDKIMARTLLPDGPKYIGIYTSAYGNARHEHYNGWATEEWVWLIDQLHMGNKDFVFVIIGAPYDADLSNMVMREMLLRGIRFVNTVGQPLSAVIEILKRQFYFIGFPSGLSILNETLGQNGLMFYGYRITGIINSWADPERIKSGEIKECLFCEPRKIYDWLKNDYKIFDK